MSILILPNIGKEIVNSSVMDKKILKARNFIVILKTKL